MTNAVTTLGGNLTGGTNILLPIIIGVIGVFLAIGLFKKFSRKAGVSA